MTGINYSYAKALSDERIRSATAIRMRRRLTPDVATHHPMRQRLAQTLIRAGIRLSPQPLELVSASRTTAC